MLDQATLFAMSGQQLEKLEVRLFSKIRKSDGCWEWTGALTKGYGITSVRRKMKNVYVHRLVYALKIGAIPAGMHVLHRCDNPRCVRPEHLFLGTNGDNCADAYAKGRNTHGEASPKSKVSAADVLSMRERYATGTVTCSGLAKEFGLSLSNVHRIITGEMWKQTHNGDGQAAISAAVVKNRGKIPQATRDAIKAALAAGERQCDVARRFHVIPSLLTPVLAGRIWK